MVVVVRLSAPEVLEQYSKRTWCPSVNESCDWAAAAALPPFISRTRHLCTAGYTTGTFGSLYDNKTFRSCGHCWVAVFQIIQMDNAVERRKRHLSVRNCHRFVLSFFSFYLINKSSFVSCFSLFVTQTKQGRRRRFGTTGRSSSSISFGYIFPPSFLLLFVTAVVSQLLIVYIWYCSSHHFILWPNRGSSPWIGVEPSSNSSSGSRWPARTTGSISCGCCASVQFSRGD